MPTQEPKCSFENCGPLQILAIGHLRGTNQDAIVAVAVDVPSGSGRQAEQGIGAVAFSPPIRRLTQSSGSPVIDKRQTFIDVAMVDKASADDDVGKTVPIDVPATVHRADDRLPEVDCRIRPAMAFRTL